MASLVSNSVPPIGAFYDPKYAGKLTPFADAGYFNGAQSTLRDKMIDPYITGYAFLKWIYIPEWVTKPFGDAGQMKAMLGKNVKSVQGLSSLTLNTGAVTAGFTANETHFATNLQKATGFSTNCQEYAGSPMRHMATHWVHGIRDPRTGIAQYPMFDGATGEYGAKYHTAEAIYIVMRPDAYNTKASGHNIEHACYLTNIMPLNVPRDHLNTTFGTNDLVEFELQWSADQHEGPNVMDMAKTLIAAHDSNFHEFVTEGAWVPPKV